MAPVLTPEQQEIYFREEGAKPNPLPPLEWLKRQGGGLPSLPPVVTPGVPPVTPGSPGAPAPVPGKTLDPSPEKTLPNQNVGRLLQFSQAMQDAVSLAKRKREQFGLEFLGKNFKPGQVNPSDFSSLVSRFGAAGESFAQNTISPAINLFSKSIDDINQIGITAAQNGAPNDIINSILSSESVGEAITKGSKWLVKQKEPEATWSEPYLLEGNLVQKNNKTNEIRTVSNMPGSWSEPYTLGGDLVQKNSKTGEVRVAVNVPEGEKGVPKEIIAELQAAQRAIQAGADANAVRRRFMERYPEKASLFNEYNKTSF